MKQGKKGPFLSAFSVGKRRGIALASPSRHPSCNDSSSSQGDSSLETQPEPEIVDSASSSDNSVEELSQCNQSEKELDLEDSGGGTPPSPDSDDDDDTTPRSPRRKGQKVQFKDLEAAPIPSVHPQTEEELVARIEKLQEKLTRTLVSFNSEKALRKRKERSLLKLAKELSNRQRDAVTLESQIAKMATKMLHMEQQLKDSNEAHDHLRALLHEQKKLNIHDGLLKAILCKNGGNESRRVSKHLKTQDEENLFDDGYATGLDRAEAGNGLFRTIMLAALFTAAAAVLRFQPQNSAFDGFCAPIMPGSVLNTQSFQQHGIEAPWWAPEEYKVISFTAICSGRRRVTLDHRNGKFRAVEVKGNRENVFFTRKGDTMTVMSNRLVIKKQNGATVDEINAPWSF